MMKQLHRRNHAIVAAKRRGVPLSDEERRALDRGAVLPMVLSLMVIGSFAVLGLLTFASTLFRIRPPIEVRDRSFWTAKSAMDMAMTRQRQFGPDGCYAGTDTISLNGFTAAVTCTPTGNYYGSGRGRFAVITTGANPDNASFSAAGPGFPTKPIDGDVFVNGGYFDEQAIDVGVSGQVLLSQYTSPGTPLARYDAAGAADGINPVDCTDPTVAATMTFPDPGNWTSNCVVQPWWDYAGDFDTATSAYDYPALPRSPPISVRRRRRRRSGRATCTSPVATAD